MTAKIKYTSQKIEYTVHIEQESISNIVACLLDDVNVKREAREWLD